MLQSNVVTDALNSFVEGIVGILPELIAGAVFILLAVVVVKAVMLLVRAGLRRLFPEESPVYRQFFATIVAAFLWFGVILSFLTIVGLQLVAASLGTATGFLALGVSYALSDMIEDAVSGVYLLRDPDFMVGDTVTIGDTTGQVASIELRKTRLRVGEDTVIRSNAGIEKQWTKRDDEPADAVDSVE